jgi:hypothetical protein
MLGNSSVPAEQAAEEKAKDGNKHSHGITLSNILFVSISKCMHCGRNTKALKCSL